MSFYSNLRISFVYILASKINGTLYISVTNNIERRLYEHKNKIHPNGFTSKYNATILVYYEQYTHINAAIVNEKKLKKLSRKRKLEIINRCNPEWKDLSEEWYKNY